MADPLYTKYVVVPTNQCNYYIYEVCARHAISTTGKYYIDNTHNKRHAIPAKYNPFFDKVFDTRADAESYAQNVLMPSILEKKINKLKHYHKYYDNLIEKFYNLTPKARFVILGKKTP